MKLFAFAVAGALLLATPSFAQDSAAPAATGASSCGAGPAAPTLPDGSTANRRQMEQGNETYQAWYESTVQYVQCRHAEVASLRAQLDARIAESNAFVESTNATGAAWRAEADEYNARNNGGRAQ